MMQATVESGVAEMILEHHLQALTIAVQQVQVDLHEERVGRLSLLEQIDALFVIKTRMVICVQSTHNWVLLLLLLLLERHEPY